MGRPWETSLTFFLAAGAGANPLFPRQIQWPDPLPASAVGPLDWSTITPPIYTQSKPPIKATSASLKVAATAADSSPPLSVDWRNRSGINYVTSPQNQGGCNSCWAFAVTALIESMIRIEHGIWAKRSEADLHDGVGAACESVGNAADSLAWVAGQGYEWLNKTGVPAPGIADWPCDPYEATAHGYEHCADRSGRTTGVPYYQALGVIEDQKRWLDEYGPLVATFMLYADFSGWKPKAETGEGAVYKWDGVSEKTGNHLAVVVGYDDNMQAWILKNSWGKGWGKDGFVYFAYDNANIDGWSKYGVSNVNPDPWARRRHQTGSMMQSGNGATHRNLELLISDASSTGFSHVSRDGTSGKWDKIADTAGVSLTAPPAILGTSFNRDFHAVGVDKNHTLRQWAYSQAGKKWSLVSSIEGTAIDGVPCLAQSDNSDLVMVVKHADGSLNEWRQPPNSTSWSLTTPTIAANVSQSGSLLQSNIALDLYHPSSASSGILYTLATLPNGHLQLFSRSGATWAAGTTIPASPSAAGSPRLIQSSTAVNETAAGAFHALVADSDGGVQHWTRANPNSHAEAGQGQWKLVQRTGSGVKNVLGLVQGGGVKEGKGMGLFMVTQGAEGGVVFWEGAEDGGWKVVETLPAGSDKGWAVGAAVTGG